MKTWTVLLKKSLPFPARRFSLSVHVSGGTSGGIKFTNFCGRHAAGSALSSKCHVGSRRRRFNADGRNGAKCANSLQPRSNLMVRETTTQLVRGRVTETRTDIDAYIACQCGHEKSARYSPAKDRAYRENSAHRPLTTIVGRFVHLYCALG